jgi:hypothetical protein
MFLPGKSCRLFWAQTPHFNVPQQQYVWNRKTYNITIPIIVHAGTGGNASDLFSDVPSSILCQ